MLGTKTISLKAPAPPEVSGYVIACSRWCFSFWCWAFRLLAFCTYVQGMLGGTETSPWRSHTVPVCVAIQEVPGLIAYHLHFSTSKNRGTVGVTEPGFVPWASGSLLATRVCTIDKFHLHCDLIPRSACTPLPGLVLAGPSVLGR